jgi:hypothetical protein
VIFKTVLALPYLSLEESFCTKTIDVPATIARIPCPIEYSNNSSISQRMLPFPATMASRAMSTGVEHGEEKMPPRIPAMKAPTNPFLVFFEIR